MPRRRSKSKRRRSPKTIKILNVAESLAYANIMTMGIAGTDAWNFVTGDDNITLGPSATFQGVYGQMQASGYPTASGVGQISLRELISNPTVSLAVMSSNAKTNAMPMVFSALTTRIGFRLFKRALRAPIANINRNIAKPLGLGVGL